MSGNTIGKLFCVTTSGESHGPALLGIVDGCPPGLEISEADIQVDLDRRKPGTSRHTTQRREPDEVKIQSGVFEGKTTGDWFSPVAGEKLAGSEPERSLQPRFSPADAPRARRFCLSFLPTIE